MKRLEVGQKFECTGDQANLPDAGEIVEVIEPTKYSQLRYRCQMESGKEKIVDAMSFEKSIGQRFKTDEQIHQEMEERRLQMEQYYANRATS